MVKQWVRDLVDRTAARQSVLPDPKRAKRVMQDDRTADVWQEEALRFPPPPNMVQTGYSQALEAMVDHDFIRGTKYGEQQYRADALKAHPVIIEFTTLLVKRMRVLGVPMFAHCIWRTREEQDRVYLAGHSKVKFPNSAHNRGCAVDIIHSTKAWNLTPKQWQVIGHVGHEIAVQKGFKLVWGGDDVALGNAYNDMFDWDPAHWELANWRAHAIARIPEPSFRPTAP